jgi:hypothetical protein
MLTLHSIWPFLWIWADFPHENGHLDIGAGQDESAALDYLAEQRRYHFRGSGKAGKA